MPFRTILKHKNTLFVRFRGLWDELDAMESLIKDATENGRKITGVKKNRCGKHNGVNWVVEDEKLVVWKTEKVRRTIRKLFLV